MDLNHRPLGYEPNELPDCSTPRCKTHYTSFQHHCQIPLIFAAGEEDIPVAGEGDINLTGFVNRYGRTIRAAFGAGYIYCRAPGGAAIG